MHTIGFVLQTFGLDLERDYSHDFKPVRCIYQMHDHRNLMHHRGSLSCRWSPWSAVHQTLRSPMRTKEVAAELSPRLLFA